MAIFARPVRSLIAATLLVAFTFASVRPAGSDDGIVPCGEFTAVHQFGESEFEFRHKNFERCSAMTPPGLTLIDATALPNGLTPSSYLVTCQCSPRLCGQNACSPSGR